MRRQGFATVARLTATLERRATSAAVSAAQQHARCMSSIPRPAWDKPLQVGRRVCRSLLCAARIVGTAPTGVIDFRRDIFAGAGSGDSWSHSGILNQPHRADERSLTHVCAMFLQAKQQMPRWGGAQARAVERTVVDGPGTFSLRARQAQTRAGPGLCPDPTNARTHSHAEGCPCPPPQPH